jgi:error-prone DNA polymerase
LLVYVSAWLKAHYPAAFTASLLGSQPMGFYAPSQLVRDAQEHGVTILPVCVQGSEWHATLEVSDKSLHAIRLGLEQVHGLGETVGSRIGQVRKSGRFVSVQDFARRCHVTQSQLLSLARAGALKSLAGDRRQAIWDSMERTPEPGSMPLFEVGGCHGLNEMKSGSGEVVNLPIASPLEDVLSDYQTSGLSLGAHPLQFIRKRLSQLGIVAAVTACTRAEGSRVVVVGVVLSRQRPATAKGIIFLTLEDETGTMNAVVPKAVWQHCDAQDRRALVLMIEGRIQRRGEVVHLLAEQLAAWDESHADGPSLVGLPRMSRDFC